MLRKEQQELLSMLREDDYRTAEHLAGLLGIGVKTVRVHIKELNEALTAYGACVESKARYGYRLKVENAALFQAMTEEANEKTDHIPDTGQERSEYLLVYLLWHEGYIKAEELCDFLYISRVTLTKALKSLELILKRYDLALDRKPNYGISLVGKETDIRRLISEYFIRRNYLRAVDGRHVEGELIRLAAQVRSLMERYEVRLSETAFETFLDYVYVSWKRISRGHSLKMRVEHLPEMGIKEQSFIRELTAWMETEEGVHYSKEEEDYLLLYLAGKRMVGNVVGNESNFVIHEQTDRLALAMLEALQQSYHLDFRNDFELRMTLNQHLVPFDVRMRFGIPLTNPLLSEIKETYSFSYQLACEAVQPLQLHYKKRVSEDEIGYFALIFELYMKKKQPENRYSILVVCCTGKGSSRLLKYKYEQEFSNYLKQIDVCDLMELEHYDLRNIDYIFTTVPITKEVNVPIVEVGVFLGEDDIRKVSDVLRRGCANWLKKYYRPERFLYGVEGSCKEDVLENICRVIAKQEDVDADFYEQVLERESYVQIDCGNNIAIPHPNRIASRETFAYVAVLKQQVTWNNSPVQVILLSSVGSGEDPDRQKFYEATASFALSAAAVHTLIRHPDYETLMRLLGGQS